MTGSSKNQNIGNFVDSRFILSRGKYAKYGALETWYDYNEDIDGDDEPGLTSYVENCLKKSKASSDGILLTTGATESTNLNNIYDIGGNVSELTLENTFKRSAPCCLRGLTYITSSLNPINKRSWGMVTIGNGSVRYAYCIILTLYEHNAFKH